MNSPKVREILTEFPESHGWLGLVLFSGPATRVSPIHGIDAVNDLLHQHQSGRWGEVTDREWEDNNVAIRAGYGTARSVWTIGDFEIEIKTVVEEARTYVTLSSEDLP